MAKKKAKFKVGDRIIEDGRVYRIFKVRRRKDENGEKNGKIIFFKPHFKKKEENGLTASIPVSNVDDARIRKPLTKKKLKKILKLLSKKTKKKKVNTTSVKSDLNKNKPKLNAKLLKQLWLDKHDDSTSFSPSKKAVYRKALRSLSEETAYVKDMSLRKARRSLKKKLKKIIPEDTSQED